MKNTALLLLAAIAVALIAQTPTVDVTGKIINAVTGEPMKGVTFTLRQGKQETSATSGEKGEFTVPGIPPGAYVRALVAKGFEMTRGGRAYTVTPGENPPLIVRLYPVSTIEGVVEDENRKPLPNISVELIAEVWDAGQRSFRNAAYPPPVTDAEGRFAIPNILPGAYYLRATATTDARKAQLEADKNGKRVAHPFNDTWFPNTVEADAAAPIIVAAGANTSGLRIRMKPAHYVTVSGRVRGLPADAKDVRLRLTPRSGRASNIIADAATTVLNRALGVVQEDGAFTIENVEPGPYLAELVNARGSAIVDVGDDGIEDLRIQASQTFSLAGRMVFDDGTPYTSGPEFETYDPVRGFEFQFVRSGQDGTFLAQNVAPGKQRILASLTTAVVSVEIGGRKYDGGVFDYGGPAADNVVVTVSKTGASIGGTVETKDSTPPAGIVTLTPSPLTPLDVRRVRNSVVNGTPSFSFAGLEGGRYRLCAWTDETKYANVMGNPRFEGRLSGDCEEVTVKHGGSEQVRLRWIDPADYK